MTKNSFAAEVTFKRGTHLGFNAIRVLKENVLTFCLHKVLINCPVSTRKSSIWFYRFFSTVDGILRKKSIHFASFSKEIFSVYFERNRNSIESKVHELKNIKKFSSLEHGPKSDKAWYPLRV